MLFRAILIFFLTLSSVSAGNLIENSSFEAGDLHGWSFGSGSFPVRSPFAVSNDSAYHGGKSMRLEQAPVSNPNYIVSRAYRLKPSTFYTLSLYAKSDPGNTLVAALHFYPVNSDGVRSGQPPGTYNVTASSAAPIPTAWTRYSYTFTTHSNSESSTYQIHIFDHWQGANGGRTNEWINVDAVQLEEGSTATPYAPRNSLEIGANLRRDVPGHVFHSGDSVALHFTGFNDTGIAAAAPLNFEVRDLWNRLLTAGAFQFAIPPQGSVTNAVALDGLPLGYFRLTYWIPALDGSLNDLQFSRTEPPVPLSHRTNSFFGSHLLSEPWFLASAQRLGVHWNRLFSVDKPGSWIRAAPTNEQVLIVSTNVALNRLYDIEPLMNIGAAEAVFRGSYPLPVPNIPNYATNSVDYWPQTNIWYSFATNVVHTYSPYVDYFEIFNEQANTGPYTNVLLWGHRAVKDAHPNGIVVAPADFYALTVDALLKIVGDDKMDIWSTHLYAYGEAGDEFFYNYTRSNVDAHGKTAFNTEAGLRTESASRANFWEDLFPFGSSRYPDESGITRDSRYRAQTMAHMFFYSMRPPIKAWFYYDGRTAAGFDNNITFSIFDYDMTIRPTALMFAGAAQRIENATMRGRLSIDSRVDAYWWKRGGAAGAVMWPTNMDEQIGLIGGTGAGSHPPRKLKLATTLSPSDFTLFDMFGNRLAYPPDGATFGIDPIYIEGSTGIPDNQFLSSLSVSSAADTEPPQLQIITYPLGEYSGDFVFRWNAVDDLSLDVRWNGMKGRSFYPLNTNAIQYRTALMPYEASYGPWTNTSWRLVQGLVWDSSTILYVQAKDAAGNISTAATFPIGFTVPAAPGDLVASAGIGTITLNWSPTAHAASYIVKRSAAPGGPYTILANSVSGTTYVDAAVSAPSTWFYLVAADNSLGTGPDSSEVSASPLPPVPGAPQSVTATVQGDHVALSWLAAQDADSYIVRRSNLSGGPYSDLATTIMDLGYHDADISPGSIYYYVVAAINPTGTGPDSAEVSATIAPPPPEGLSAVAEPGAITISWSPSPGAESYLLKRGELQTGPFAVLAENLTTFSYRDATPLPGITYFYVVAAVNSSGASPDSAPISGAALQFLPEIPTGVTASGTLASIAGESTITVRWLPVNGASSYRVRRALTPSGPWTSVADALVSTDFTQTVPVDGSTFYYVVAASSAAGSSADSTPASVQPLAPVPVNLTSTSLPGRKVQLRWNDMSSDEQGFRIESTTTGSWSQIGTASAGSTTFTTAVLNKRTTYSFRIRAYKGSLNTAYSPTVVVSIP